MIYCDMAILGWRYITILNLRYFSGLEPKNFQNFKLLPTVAHLVTFLIFLRLISFLLLSLVWISMKVFSLLLSSVKNIFSGYLIFNQIFYFWLLFWLIASIKLNICNPGCVVNCALLLYVQLKYHLLVTDA